MGRQRFHTCGIVLALLSLPIPRPRQDAPPPTITSTQPFRAPCSTITCRVRSPWKGCSTAAATSTTISGCFTIPVQNLSAEASAYGGAKQTCWLIFPGQGYRCPKYSPTTPTRILEACIFEIVTSQVDQVPIPDWAFTAFGLPVERRNFRYADMCYTDGRFVNQWGKDGSVPDVSRPETRLWFYYLAASYIDLGFEAIHYGQVELMNKNDPDLAYWSQVFAMARTYGRSHARRHILLCDAHTPGGGFVRDGRLLLDFHAFPLRIKEVPDTPQAAKLELGFSDGLYRRSKGGITPGGWTCDHLPYLVEFDNYGVSKAPGQAGQGHGGFDWVWGYDEITWFAHQSLPYRRDWLRYAWDWVGQVDTNAHLEMPGSRTMTSPLDHKKWYYANDTSPAVPEGLGDEEAIAAIWKAAFPGFGQ